eukprot:Phypoly_transcript_01526.p1 GENE.Phypoly_transcript_01526~~Phypoly_transcript_01526.p1  ORF type:complete len:780 (-),score=98.01 Phypoly_transcript_01526:986-3034(-)
MDGEFWFGRGQYPSIYMLLNSSPATPWHFLRAISFDVPCQSYFPLPLEERYKILLHSSPLGHPFIITAARILAENQKHLKWFLQGIITEEGEGLILHRHASLFESGRTKLLLKIKTVQADREGVVVRVGTDKSVLLKLPDGQIITVPAKNVEVPIPLTGGDVVTFSFEVNARRDLPVNPKIYRIRTDVSWPEIVQNYKRDQQFLSDSSQVAGFKSQPLGHWTKKTMRNFMEKFAKLWKMDPLVPDTWYRLQFRNIRKYKGGKAIMQKFKGYVNAVRSLFPDVTFDNQAFLLSSWSDIRNRRKFFEDFAKNHRFDPLKPENWYKQTKEKLKTTKGAYGVLSYHKLSISQALIDLFPNIGLEKSRFHAKNAWHEEKNRRGFFEEFAHSMGFDPLHADKWYSQYSALTTIKGIYSVIQHHGYSISKSLLSLFPDVQFDKAKFQSKSWVHKNGSMWNNAEDRRRFFTEYALSRKFDPLIPENWYSEPRERIMATSGAFRVMHHHNRSLAQALNDLFPEIGIEKSKFAFHASWKKKEMRRKFFEDYAKKHGFNPLIPSQWYSHPVENLLSEKVLSSIIHYHNKSLMMALLDLFPEIGLARTALKTWRFKKAESWSSVENQRRFFEDFARQNGFDPLHTENWYSQKKGQNHGNQGGYGNRKAPRKKFVSHPFGPLPGHWIEKIEIFMG